MKSIKKFNHLAFFISYYIFKIQCVFTLTEFLSVDVPYFKYAITTCGQCLLYWAARFQKLREGRDQRACSKSVVERKWALAILRRQHKEMQGAENSVRVSQQRRVGK